MKKVIIYVVFAIIAISCSKEDGDVAPSNLCETSFCADSDALRDNCMLNYNECIDKGGSSSDCQQAAELICI